MIFNTLKVQRDYNYIFFLKYNQKFPEIISLHRLKEGIQKEEFAIKTLKLITEKARNAGLNID